MDRRQICVLWLAVIALVAHVHSNENTSDVKAMNISKVASDEERSFEWLHHLGDLVKKFV
ncbi:uncharacterized protein PHALS_14738 [Plasmopara halstedii]|uniref:RxLR-like protein n=1 Tax=Plasmopara halstedii TaxID=4781 RepID=A0A0P1AQA4_PLAHL|nr:uncharacterized protein PHALS_14738 [Plasmopara halstedii]CEG43656.1 hypothetical protein PHALS_14738 [Plasmopara halstedii]|eukprot:XP_024580025.1 hypothetical protein PHALS_14738 [Plasmopara halstedii]